MKTRFLAAVIVACCLLLCGLILRRQIAAHPLPPEAAQSFEDNRGGPGQGRFWMEGWRPASSALAAQAQKVIAGQLSALKAGDGPKAWSYQSRSLRQNFGSPTQFMQTIARQYPEFIHYRRALYRQVFTDSTGRTIHALVLLEDENGNHSPQDYLLVREAGGFKVNGVRPLPWPQGRR